MLPERDKELVQIVDASLADATERARKSDGSSWLACRPGCTDCCQGVFRISVLDAERLRGALAELARHDPTRADDIQVRALAFVNRFASMFPGNAVTGRLDPEEQGTWDEFADLPEADVPCPVLDPSTGRCELYSGRPLTCRIFGPPVMNEEGIGICKLCYDGANEVEVLAGEMHLLHHELEEEIGLELPNSETIIAWALRPKQVE
jgi:Fe-S-cluster containining protein